MNLDLHTEKGTDRLRAAKSICERTNLAKDFDLAQGIAASAPSSGADKSPLQRP